MPYLYLLNRDNGEVKTIHGEVRVFGPRLALFSYRDKDGFLCAHEVSPTLGEVLRDGLWLLTNDIKAAKAGFISALNDQQIELIRKLQQIQINIDILDDEVDETATL